MNILRRSNINNFVSEYLTQNVVENKSMAFIVIIWLGGPTQDFEI